MPKFYVKVREIHEATYAVEANGAEAAFAAIDHGQGVLVDNSDEFIETTRPDLWQIVAGDDKPQKPTTLAEILSEWICEKVPNEDDRNEVLDELVHDLASSTGSDTNNGGTEEQIGFVIAQCGIAEARKTIEQAFGDES